MEIMYALVREQEWELLHSNGGKKNLKTVPVDL